MPRITRRPEFATDRDGKAIALVPLANHPAPARLLRDDWERLVRAGVSTQWTLNTVSGIPYVRCGARKRGRLETVARLIMRATPYQTVGYRTGDRLNLRPDNLKVTARSVRKVGGGRSHGPAAEYRA